MMLHPKFLPYLVNFDALQRFSGDGKLYRAYDHLIAAANGTLLVAPIIVVQGRFHDVVDGCPVPWEEAYSVIEAESLPFMMELVHMPTISAELDKVGSLCLDRSQWQFDFIGVHDEERRNILRFKHASGVRYAVAARFVV